MCVYIFTHVHTHTHTHTIPEHILSMLFSPRGAYTKHISTCKNICIHMNINMYTEKRYIHACIYICTYTHTHIHCRALYMCPPLIYTKIIYICVYSCIKKKYIYACTCIYAYTHTRKDCRALYMCSRRGHEARASPRSAV